MTFTPTRPTYLQAQEAYQFFLEFCRLHPDDEEAQAALVYAESLRDTIWFADHSHKASLPWRYGKAVS